MARSPIVESATPIMRFASLARAPSPDLASLSRAGARLLERWRLACASTANDTNRSEYSAASLMGLQPSIACGSPAKEEARHAHSTDASVIACTLREVSLGYPSAPRPEPAVLQPHSPRPEA